MFLIFLLFIFAFVGCLLGFVNGASDQECWKGEKFEPLPNRASLIFFTYPIAYRVGFYLFKPLKGKAK